MRLVIALFTGILFGLGLSYAQMIDPNKVINFLDITGTWDPSLAFVLAGGLVLNTMAYHLTRKRASPVLAGEVFHQPAKSDIDSPLIIGSVLFGVGWAAAGYCPGPIFASLSFGGQDVWLIMASYAIGTLATKLALRHFQKRQSVILN